MTSHRILIDSNVLLDIFTEDARWCAWSSEKLAASAEDGILCINPVIYAEISVGFERIEELEAVLPREYFQHLPIPREAAFLAGKCFLKYRQVGGVKRSPLPDFFIGAHAVIEKMTILTRDAARYRTYFPMIKLISPRGE